MQSPRLHGKRNAHQNRIPVEGHGSWLMQAFCGSKMDAYENRIPIHYIKGHPFWVE